VEKREPIRIDRRPHGGFMHEPADSKMCQQQAKIKARQAEEAATGRTKRGRKPKAAAANVTDPDSRIMKTQAGYVHGDNAHAVVTEA
jgi:hypothetical protein